MKEVMLKLYLAVQRLPEDCGQDLIEYVLIGGVVALGAVAGMQTFAADVNTAFSTLGSMLSSYS